MIALGSYYRIAEREVEATYKDDNGPDEYPHRLTVRTKAGHDYTVNYNDERRRDAELGRITAAVETYDRDHDPTIDIIRWIIEGEVNKLRPYLRRIEKAQKEAHHDPTA